MNHSDTESLRRQMREDMKKKRSAVTSEEAGILCEQIQCHIKNYFSQHPGLKTIMSFYPIQNEASPLSKAMIQDYLKEGKTLLLPRVESVKPPSMAAVRYEGLDKGIYTPWDIFEPEGPAADPRTIDCVLVPGLAFDTQGYRLGYGKGFYDRFLPQIRPDTLTIGIAYSFQQVPETWPQMYDVRLKALLTEKGFTSLK